MLIELINGEPVLVEYSASKYLPATFYEPAEGGFEEITKVLWTAPCGKKVDILSIISDADYEHLVDQIIAKMDKRNDDDY